MSHVKVLFGTASFGSVPMETSQEFLDILKKHQVKDLDTAHLYVSYDETLGIGAESTRRRKGVRGL